MSKDLRPKYTYRCLGCGKEYHTYKFYPYGWICLNCRPNTKVMVKCSECGCKVPVSWDTYRMKDPDIPWRCRSCNDKYRNALYEAKPEEEKKAFVESQIARTKKYYAEMTDEERALNSQHRKNGWDKRRQDGTAERIVESMKRGRKEWIDSMSQTQFIQWRVELAKQRLDLINTDPDSYMVSVVGKMTSSEKDFDNILKTNRLKYVYQYPSVEVHPDFSKKFPSNPVSNSKFVDPTHLWDFCIITNDSKILVDIDGSIHNPANNNVVTSSSGQKFVLAEYQKFRDAQRPYQTDGLPAYVVQVYTDKVEKDTSVFNISSGEVIPLWKFISMLCWLSMSDADQKASIKLL